MNAESVLGYVRESWPSPFSPRAWKVIGVYAAIELVIMRLMPGREFKATITPMGNVPIYKANGLQSYFFSIFLLAGLTYSGILEPGRIYDMFGELLSAINLFGLLFCAFLTLKG